MVQSARSVLHYISHHHVCDNWIVAVYRRGAGGDRDRSVFGVVKGQDELHFNFKFIPRFFNLVSFVDMEASVVRECSSSLGLLLL